MIQKMDLGTILVLELARPLSNALSYELLKALYKELLRAEKDIQKICIVIQSKYDNCFSSGLDLGNMPTGKYQQKLYIFKLVYMMRRIVRFITCSRKIYISSLKGAVIGSAVSLALACDFCFAAPNVWFWLPDPFYGGLQADGGIDFIRNYGGILEARKWCLTNQRISVREAWYMRIISGIIDKRNLSEEIQNFCLMLSKYSSIALKETKKRVNKDICGPLPLLSLCKVIWSKEMEERISLILKNRRGERNESEKSSGHHYWWFRGNWKRTG